MSLLSSSFAENVKLDSGMGFESSSEYQFKKPICELDNHKIYADVHPLATD